MATFSKLISRLLPLIFMKVVLQRRCLVLIVVVRKFYEGIGYISRIFIKNKIKGGEILRIHLFCVIVPALHRHSLMKLVVVTPSADVF